MRSRLHCALQGIMIFATPTYRGGGHLLPSYNAFEICRLVPAAIQFLQRAALQNITPLASGYQRKCHNLRGAAYAAGEPAAIAAVDIAVAIPDFYEAPIVAEEGQDR